MGRKKDNNYKKIFDIIGFEKDYIYIYSFLLLLQYWVIIYITWNYSSFYFISLSFSLLLLFILIIMLFSSIISTIILLIFIYINIWFIYIIISIFIGIILVFVWLYLKDKKIIEDKYYKYIKKTYNIVLFILVLIVYFINFIFIWDQIINKNNNVTIKNSEWKIENYRLRFYNIDYYFFETWATIKILDRSDVKSIEFIKN